jgi:triosephosphate isomerase
MEIIRKNFVGGNWKSNNTQAETKSIVENVLNKLNFDSAKVDVVAAPVSLQISYVESLLTNKNVQIAAQNCSDQGFGAFTGEISSLHLKDANIPWVILGHSERRSLYGENDDLVAKKTKLAIDNGISVMFCIGESFAEFESKTTLAVLQRQLEALKKTVGKDDWKKIVVAYEPVWAIGTGKVATPEIAQSCHEFIRTWISTNVDEGTGKSTRIIYGGSVNEKNCTELKGQKDIDGFLVGGASLKPGFIQIVESCSK